MLKLNILLIEFVIVFSSESVITAFKFYDYLTSQQFDFFQFFFFSTVINKFATFNVAFPINTLTQNISKFTIFNFEYDKLKAVL